MALKGLYSIARCGSSPESREPVIQIASPPFCNHNPINMKNALLIRTLTVMPILVLAIISFVFTSKSYSSSADEPIVAFLKDHWKDINVGSYSRRESLEAVERLLSDYPFEDVAFLVLEGTFAGWLTPTVLYDAESSKRVLSKDTLFRLKRQTNEKLTTSAVAIRQLLVANWYVEAYHLSTFSSVDIPEDVARETKRILEELAVTLKDDPHLGLLHVIEAKLGLYQARLKVRGAYKGAKRREFISIIDASLAQLRIYKDKYHGSGHYYWFAYLEWQFLKDAPHYYCEHVERLQKRSYNDAVLVPVIADVLASKIESSSLNGQYFGVRYLVRLQARGYYMQDLAKCAHHGTLLLQEYPDLLPVEKSITYTMLAGYAKSNGKLAEAEALLQKALETDPTIANNARLMELQHELKNQTTGSIIQ